MRLDKFLKVSRIIKRRVVANNACDMGRVDINGRQAKASTQVKSDDVLRITFGSFILTAKVVEDTNLNRPHDSYYEIIEQQHTKNNKETV